MIVVPPVLEVTDCAVATKVDFTMLKAPAVIVTGKYPALKVDALSVAQTKSDPDFVAETELNVADAGLPDNAADAGAEPLERSPEVPFGLVWMPGLAQEFDELRVIDTVALEVVGFPFTSCACTVRFPSVASTLPPVGLEVKASFDAAPAVIVITSLLVLFVLL